VPPPQAAANKQYCTYYCAVEARYCLLRGIGAVGGIARDIPPCVAPPGGACFSRAGRTCMLLVPEVRRRNRRPQAQTPRALVTLCGTLGACCLGVSNYCTAVLAGQSTLQLWISSTCAARVPNRRAQTTVGQPTFDKPGALWASRVRIPCPILVRYRALSSLISPAARGFPSAAQREILCAYSPLSIYIT
jgi:hypothetical protein